MVLCGLALWVSVTGGCNPVDDSPQPLSLQVTENDREGNNVRVLEGVEVCEGDTANCEVTDANGEVAMRLPVGDEFFLTLDKDGYEATLWVDVNDDRFIGVRRQATMWRDETAADWYQVGMQQYPPTGVGTIWVTVFPYVEGYTLDLVDATGTRFYMERTEEHPFHPNFELEATSSLGRGGFFEVVSGEFQIELGGTVGDCFPDRAWPGDAANRFRFPVREGFVTFVRILCPF